VTDSYNCKAMKGKISA